MNSTLLDPELLREMLKLGDMAAKRSPGPSDGTDNSTMPGEGESQVAATSRRDDTVAEMVDQDASAAEGEFGGTCPVAVVGKLGVPSDGLSRSLDTNADGNVTSSDALLVVNWLNEW